MIRRFTVIPAVYVVFKKNEEVLLLKRANTHYFDGFYSLPAGHVDGGEPAIQAAIREVKEEVGVKLAADKLLLRHTMHRFSDVPESHERIDLYFEVQKWPTDPFNAEPEKCSDLAWFRLDRLPQNITPEVKQALKNINNGVAYSDLNF